MTVSSRDQLKSKYGDSFLTKQSEQSDDNSIIHDQWTQNVFSYFCDGLFMFIIFIPNKIL